MLLTTFGMIFLAEMGDKTQLAAKTRQPFAVLLGAALALTCVSALGVTVGALLSQHLPMQRIERAAAAAFIVVGTLMLLGKM